MVMVFIAMLVFGCGKFRVSKIQEQLEQERAEKPVYDKPATVTRNGIQTTIQPEDITVGDKVMLAMGDIVPCDCAIIYTENSQELVVDESRLFGEADGQHKKSLGHFNQVSLTKDTICFAGTRIISGNAYGFTLAVGDQSTARDFVQSLEVKEGVEDDHDLIDKHFSVLSIFIVVLLIASGLLFVQSGLNSEIGWYTALNVAVMMFVYGFPYILAIPAIWDVALRNTISQLADGKVKVQRQETVDDVASLDYLAVQSIGVLDTQADDRKNMRQVRRLQAMGVKVVLATGVAEEDARRIAVSTGILRKEHERICGAVISGKQLRQIAAGIETDIGFDITPEYLSVVYRASEDDRATLVDYLQKVHPGRIHATRPVMFGSDELKRAPPVAIVGAIGSGDNDVKMLKKANVSFSTSEKCTENAQDNADMVLQRDDLRDVALAMTHGRAYKDHLLKFMLLQVPASISAIAMVLSQVFFYDTILVTGCFVFLINLVYFPLAIVCYVKESNEGRHDKMLGRWRSIRYPGTKTITGYMRAESLKLSMFVVTIYQVAAMAGLYYYADSLFSLIDSELEWQPEDSLFVDTAYLHRIAPGDGNIKIVNTSVQVGDLTDKGLMFLIIFQTFAYLQIFNILNARRPSYKDLNPFEGLSFLTVFIVIVLLGFQYGVACIPTLFDYGTIGYYENLLCMAVGAGSLVWYTLLKMFIWLIKGSGDHKVNQA